jgi:hypothetical protein
MTPPSLVFVVNRMAQFWKLDSDHQVNMFGQHVSTLRLAGKPPTVKFLGDDSTTRQNALIWALYRAISKETGEGVIETRRFWKLHYGVAILKSADPEFSDFYDANLKPLDYPTKLQLMDWLDITSTKEFTKELATEYIETIIKSYSEKGIHIAADPAQEKNLPYL